VVKVRNIFIFFLFFVCFALFHSPIYSAEKNIITPIFPVRGREYWRQDKDIKYLTDLVNLVQNEDIQATWLVQYDALLDEQIISVLRGLDLSKNEIGLFMEVTRKLDDASFVYYDWQYGHWSSANKVFLSGYTRAERQRLIDKSFSDFKEVFGYYPHSYGSWYVDVYSMEYIKNKYGLDAVLGLADQYSTDGYQTWGQYINQPYYVSKKSALEPALSENDNTEVVKVLWAPREPTLSYGSTGNSSNYSVQVNDYHRYHGLDINYFQDLLETSTINIQGHLSQLVIGIEVAELETEYLPELKKQLQLIKEKQDQQELSILTLSNFSKVYHQTFKEISPPVFTTSTQQDIASYWYTSPTYRLGLFLSDGNLEIRDLRQYHQNGLRDNDQVRKDMNHNLNRVVPALIDHIALKNKFILGPADQVEINQVGEKVTLSWPQGQIALLPDKILFEGVSQASFGQSTPEGWQVTFDSREISSLSGLCSSEYGKYSQHGCWDNVAVWLSEISPNIRYSSLFGQKYLGIKTRAESFWGIRVPQLKIGYFHFEYPLLDNFVLVNKFKEFNPEWFGKQEQELEDFAGKGEVKKKFAAYGWESLLEDIPKDIVFENSYYLITHETKD